MFALQVGFSPVLLLGLLLFVLVAVLVVVGGIVLLKRVTDDDGESRDQREELEALKRRVERLEAEQEQ